MGTYKKEKARRERSKTAGDGMANVKVKGENFYRDAKKVKKLNILREGKPIRNKEGEIVSAAHSTYPGEELSTDTDARK